MKPKQDDRFAQQSFLQSDPIHNWVVHIDGASRNNPGKAGAGIFMKKDGETVCKEGFFLGIKTNNQAEYYALLLALFLIQKYAKTDDRIRIASDSELLVKQMASTYKIKNPGLKPLFSLAQSMLKQYPTIQIMHVMREDNVDADALANKGIDTKKPIPQPFVTMIEKHGISL